MNNIPINKILKGVYQVDDIKWEEGIYSSYTKSEFDKYEFNRIYKKFPSFDWLIYYYGTGDDEGVGVILIKQNNKKYYLFSLAHCCCWDPTDEIDPEKKSCKSIDEILKNTNEDYIEWLYPILKFIKENNNIFKEEGQWLKKIKKN